MQQQHVRAPGEMLLLLHGLWRQLGRLIFYKSRQIPLLFHILVGNNALPAMHDAAEPFAVGRSACLPEALDQAWAFPKPTDRLGFYYS